MSRGLDMMARELSVHVEMADATLEGDLALPEGPQGIVAFAHGSGSSRRSARNRYVARALQEAGMGTLLMDLLTPQEAEIDERTAELRFDIPLLSRRMVGAVDWLAQYELTRGMRLGCFGASTGAAGALVAAAERQDKVWAVVSRGGRPDLAGDYLGRVRAPTLLIVGGNDEPVITLNRQALEKLGAEERRLDIIPGATHLFEEPGTLEEVAQRAADWFARNLSRAA